MSSKRLIIFDLDGTLAESKSPIDDEMGELLGSLLLKVPVSVVFGGLRSFKTVHILYGAR